MARSLVRTLAVVLSLLVAGLAVVAHAEVPKAQGNPVTLEWLGWNAWRATSPEGKVVLFNPFVNNPDSVVRGDAITQADLILVTNGHVDEVGQTLEIARNTEARIVPAGWGFGGFFIENGIPAAQVVRLSPGERLRSGGITVRVLNGIHGSDINAQPGPSATIPSGGIAGSFMVTFENGWTVYYAGSSAATQDMALWARMYQPDAVILNMNGTKEPMDFAMAVQLLQTDNPNLNTVFPGHHRFLQAATDTSIAETQAAMRAMGIGLDITEPAPGQSFTFAR
jgi:L-ascorbate metabolism protein UlaG (beta-lactamase superfamily)